MSEIGTNVHHSDSDAFKKIRADIESWRSTPQASGAVGAFDWTLLLTVVPMLLRIFIKDETLRGIIDQIIQVVIGLFKK